MKFRDSAKELHITSQIVCHSALEVPRKITSVVFSLFPIISHVTAQMIKGQKRVQREWVLRGWRLMETNFPMAAIISWSLFSGPWTVVNMIILDTAEPQGAKLWALVASFGQGLIGEIRIIIGTRLTVICVSIYLIQAYVSTKVLNIIIMSHAEGRRESWFSTILCSWSSTIHRLPLQRQEWGFSTQIRDRVSSERSGSYSITTFSMKMEIEAVTAALRWMASTQITMAVSFWFKVDVK